jgi:type IV pilus assembly protein PilY1
MTTPRLLLKKALVGWLAYATAFGPLAPTAFAASIDYSDVPLPAKKRPNPNLIFAIDDSGSMDFELALNGNDGSAWYYTAGLSVGSGTVDGKTTPSFWGLNQLDRQQTGVPNFNLNGIPNGTWKKYSYVFSNGYFVDSATRDRRTLRDASHDHFVISPSQQFGAMRSPDFNRQYYNPTITYLPWKPYNNPSNTCISGTATGSGNGWLCTPGNADYRAARYHPIYGGDKIDLTQDVGQNTSTGYYFRLYDGMRVLPGSKLRRCTNAGDGSGCEGWMDVEDLLCIGDSAAALTSCNAGGAGLNAGNANLSGGKWRNGGGGAAQIPMGTFDHAEMAASYFPSRYFISENSTIVANAGTTYGSFPWALNAGPLGERMKLIEIRSGTNSYPKAATRTDCAGATCTYLEEIQNFANWFQYYRKRTMSLNAAIGNSLDGLNALRAGMFTFNNHQNVTMLDFDKVGDFANNERRIIGLTYDLKGNGGTPTRQTMDYMGKQYQRTGSSAPITAPCQFNAGFIITDGFANQGTLGGYGNLDNVSPSTNVFTKQYNEDPLVVNTDPYKDKWADTLADMAMYYYTVNLRPDLQAGRVPIDVNDIAPDADKNKNLHMNTYGLVLGLSGWMFGNPNFPLQNADPYTNPPNWDAIDSVNQIRNPSAIDELWHATLNGRGTMLRADSPEETRNAVLDVVNNVVAKGGAAAAVSVSNAIPTAGDNFTYQTSYNAGAWSGDINAFTIDLQTGAVSTTPAWPLSAQKALADRDWTGRTIVTYNQAALPNPTGIPFQWADLTTAQRTALGGMSIGGTAIPGSWVLDWIRGDRSREGQFLRSRGPRKDPFTGVWKGGVIPNNVGVLADLVNAEPVYVREPRFNYADAGYTAFKSAWATRTKVLYVAGNGGKVHVFNGSTGVEMWAYVPSFGFQTPTGFSSAGLRNLADKEYFVHRFLVDSTPFSGDVDLDKAGSPTGSGSSNWATMVLGGLGKGGRGVYAINATTSDLSGGTPAAREANAASKIMWEFPNPAIASHAAVRNNVGYVFGRPVLAKTKAAGWVVLVPSGYENGDETGGDGRGHLFVLNPATGVVLADLRTIDAEDGATSAANRSANPRGLGHIAAFATSPADDATIDMAYGGDLYGNVWRFDFSGANITDWNVKRLATLVDAGGNRQPVTSEPELGTVAGFRTVYVGTGRYFGDKDIPGVTGAFFSATGRQTIYALKDDLSPSPTPIARSEMISQTVSKAGGFAQVTNNAVDFNTKRGWYVDLPDTGERIITNPVLAAGVISLTSNVPDGSDPCLPGGRSWLYAFDYRSGSYVPGATYAGKFIGDALASRVNLIRVGSGVKGLIRTSAGETRVVDEPGSSPTARTKRKSWREVMQ